MEKQLSAHQFKEIYDQLDININDLGCVMLDLASITLADKADYNFYTSPDKSKFWMKGWVASETPHVTLLYGLLSPAADIREQVRTVLKGWKISEVFIEDIDFFDSPYEDEPYYCIIAKIRPDANLIEGHQRLEFLPHINTFAGYVPHFTLAYLEKDEAQRDKLIEELKQMLKGKSLKVKPKLNLGSSK